MQAWLIWWVLALVLGLAELFTGTFYLVMIAAGCLLGGLAAFQGAGLTWQLLAAAIGVGVGAFWLRAHNRSSASTLPADADPGVMLDVGGRVEVASWLSPRRTEVRYRGAAWQVELLPDTPDGQPGSHEIVRVSGNTLIVRPVDV